MSCHILSVKACCYFFLILLKNLSILLKRILYPYFSEGIAIRKIITCSVLLPVLTAIFLSIAMGMDHFWMKQKSLPVFWNGRPWGGGGVMHGMEEKLVPS